MIIYLKSIENQYTGDAYSLEGMIKDKQSYYESACEYLKGRIFGLKYTISNLKAKEHDTDLLEFYESDLMRCESLLNSNHSEFEFDIINFYLKAIKVTYEGVELNT